MIFSLRPAAMFMCLALVGSASAQLLSATTVSFGANPSSQTFFAALGASPLTALPSFGIDSTTLSRSEVLAVPMPSDFAVEPAGETIAVGLRKQRSATPQIESFDRGMARYHEGEMPKGEVDRREFRIDSVPEPTSLLALTLGLVGYRSRRGRG